jgi:hypothetical protein
VVSFTSLLLYPPGKEQPVPIGYEAGWAPEPVWTTGRRENSWPYRDSNSDPSVVQPVASLYTDCAIPAPFIFWGSNQNCINFIWWLIRRSNTQLGNLLMIVVFVKGNDPSLEKHNRSLKVAVQGLVLWLTPYTYIHTFITWITTCVAFGSIRPVCHLILFRTCADSLVLVNVVQDLCTTTSRNRNLESKLLN